MIVLADTSFFVGLLHGKDKHHAQAQVLYQAHHGNILTTPWVIVEVCNFFSKGNARPLAIDFLQAIRTTDEIALTPLDPQSYEAGAQLFASREDKGWSLTDCITMAIATDRHITHILTTDHHFAQAGFTPLMPPTT